MDFSPAETERILRGLENFQRDNEWFYSNRERLRARFTNRYVAVYARRVVGTDADLDRLLAKLRKRYGKLVGHFVVEFLPEKDSLLILAAG